MISARAETSYLLEEIATRLDFKYRQEIIEEDSIVKFHFLLNASDTIMLIKSIPQEVYAFRGEFRISE